MNYAEDKAGAVNSLIDGKAERRSTGIGNWEVQETQICCTTCGRFTAFLAWTSCTIPSSNISVAKPQLILWTISVNLAISAWHCASTFGAVGRERQPSISSSPDTYRSYSNWTPKLEQDSRRCDYETLRWYWKYFRGSKILYSISKLHMSPDHIQLKQRCSIICCGLFKSRGRVLVSARARVTPDFSTEP